MTDPLLEILATSKMNEEDNTEEDILNVDTLDPKEEMVEGEIKREIEQKHGIY